jgi:hypothetical protein
MNTAIAHLTQQRDTLLENAAVAHKEGRTDDRDRQLNDANDLSAAIRQLQGITEPELPGMREAWEAACNAINNHIKPGNLSPHEHERRNGLVLAFNAVAELSEMPTESAQPGLDDPAEEWIPSEPKQPSWEDFLHEARQIAAQCWCDDKTKHYGMNEAMCEAVAKRIALWMDTAAQQTRNAEFYRDLLDRCAQHLGDEVFICDDGSRCDEPLRLKIPELVAKVAEGKCFSKTVVPQPDITTVGWVDLKNGRFLPDALAANRAMVALGYQKATAHIYLDKP